MPDPADIRVPRPAGAQPQNVAGDLALFGAIPAAFAGNGAQAADRSAITVAPATPLASSSAADEGHATLSHVASSALTAPTVPEATPIATGTVAVASPSPAPVGQDAAPVSAPIGTFVPMPVGSGTPPPAPTAVVPDASGATPAPAAVDAMVPDTGAAAASETIASLAAIRESLDAVQTMVAKLSTPVGEAHDAVLPAVNDLGEQIDRITDSVVDGAASLAGTTVGGTLETLGDVAVPAVTSLVAPLADVADTATDAVTGLVSGVAADAPLIAPLADLAGSATAGVAAVLPAAVDAVLAPAAQDDGVLGGADPVAGVTTLVGMVSAADAFALHDSGTPVEALSPALGPIGAVDGLIGDSADDILLGVTPHHDEGGAAPDHGHGLLDLGGL